MMLCYINYHHLPLFENLWFVDYLYFCDDEFLNNPNSESWKRFKRFVQFEAMVFFRLSISDVNKDDFSDKLKAKLHEKPENLSKLGVYICEGSVPSMTFFYGHKKVKDNVSKKQALWYIGAEPFYQEGNPQKIFLIEDETFWSDLNNEYMRAINKKIKYLKGKEIFETYIGIEKNKQFPS